MPDNKKSFAASLSQDAPTSDRAARRGKPKKPAARPGKKPTVKRGFEIEAETLERLQTIADDHNVTVAALVRHLLRVGADLVDSGDYALPVRPVAKNTLD